MYRRMVSCDDVSSRYMLCVCVALVLCALTVCAQLGKYALPSAEYTPCYTRNGTQKSYCPPGMWCVQSQYSEGLYIRGLDPEDTVSYEYTAPGCCANETDVPCLSPHSRVYAPICCPTNTSCCFDTSSPHMPFIGCVEDARQCCGANICPLGYSCCRTETYSYCCPGLEACSPVVDVARSSPQNGTRLSFIPNTFGSLANASDGFPRRIQYTECARVENNTRTPWLDSEAFPCGTERSWCLNSTEDVCVNNLGTPLNTTNRTLLEDNGAFCCPVNSTACVRRGSHMSNTNVFGCADEAAGEECCGHQVCAAGSRCCKVPSPPLWDTSFIAGKMVPRPLPNNTEVNSLTSRCCPLGTYCCAIYVPAANGADGQQEIMTFCGRNENCTSLATVSETVQPMPSRRTLLPDYIEALGWFATTDDKITFFADQWQNTCGCVSCANPACKDQLQLVSDVGDCNSA